MTVSLRSDRTVNDARKTDSIDSLQLRQASELAIELLARETHVDIGVVRSVYEHEHQRLAAQAKIKTYLPVITARIVRMTLREESVAQMQ